MTAKTLIDRANNIVAKVDLLFNYGLVKKDLSDQILMLFDWIIYDGEDEKNWGAAKVHYAFMVASYMTIPDNYRKLTAYQLAGR